MLMLRRFLVTTVLFLKDMQDYYCCFMFCFAVGNRQMNLGQFLRQLTRLAEEFGIAVVLTNQVSWFPIAIFHAHSEYCLVIP